MPDLDELPQANNVVLSDLYALTTKVHYCALDIPSSQDLSRKQTTFVDGVGGGGGGGGGWGWRRHYALDNLDDLTH